MSAEYAHLRRLPLDELRILAKHTREMLDTEGWKHLQNLLAAKQQAELQKILLPPSNAETADQYALKRAQLSGFLKGVQHAYEAPLNVLKIAEEELERSQREAEQAQRETEEIA